MRTLISIVFTFLVGAFIATIFGLNPIAGGCIICALALLKVVTSQPLNGVLNTSIDVSGITGFSDQNQKELIATLVNGLDIANDVMVQPNVKNKIKLPKLAVGNGFRPYSPIVNFGKGDIQFTERELETRTGKRELLLEIKAFKDKYLAWQTNAGNGANKKFDDYAFAKFVWQQVIKSVQREINDETAYFGFDKALATLFDGGTAYPAKAYVTFIDPKDGINKFYQNVSGAATTAGQTPATHPAKWRDVSARAVAPGLGVILDKIIADGFPVVTTGAISDITTAVNAFKRFFRAAPVPYQREGVIVNCSYTDAQFLIDGLESNISKYTTPEVSNLMQKGLIPIPGTQNKGWVKPATWMGSSRRLIGTPMFDMSGKSENLYMGTDLLSDGNEIKTVEALWTIEAGISMDIGWQIADLGALIINDQQ